MTMAGTESEFTLSADRALTLSAMEVDVLGGLTELPVPAVVRAMLGDEVADERRSDALLALLARNLVEPTDSGFAVANELVDLLRSIGTASYVLAVLAPSTDAELPDLLRVYGGSGHEVLELPLFPAVWTYVPLGDGQVEEMIRAKVLAGIPETSAAGGEATSVAVTPAQGTLELVGALAGAEQYSVVLAGGESVRGVGWLQSPTACWRLEETPDGARAVPTTRADLSEAITSLVATRHDGHRGGNP